MYICIQEYYCMQQLTSLDYFKGLELDLFYEVAQIIDDPQHHAHTSIQNDLTLFNDEDITVFLNQYGQYASREEDKEAYARCWLLVNLLQKRIKEERNRLLISPGNRPEPYNYEEIINSDVNDDGLISTKELEPYYQSVLSGDFAYRLCPVTTASNSSYWLFNLILKEAYHNKREFKIRLDPLIRIHKDSYSPLMQKMTIYGDKLDWEKISALEFEDHGQWFGHELSSSEIGITDYVWSPYDKEVHFTCEELPKEDEIPTRGSRYFHAIFDKATGKIIHCDGAIRFYTIEEFAHRSRFHVRKAEARKVGIRRKIFQIDEVIDQQLFMNLATNFFVWNQDALNYFNTETF